MDEIDSTGQEVLQKTAETLFLFLTGGVVYFGIEVLYRGWSHWSMALLGGFCFYEIHRLRERIPGTSVFLRSAIGALIITVSEFFTGCLVNLYWGMGVWDYSDVPLNFLGQICLPFSILWFFLCIPVNWLDSLISRYVFLRRGTESH